MQNHSNTETNSLNTTVLFGTAIIGFVGAGLLIKKMFRAPMYTKTNRIDGKVVIITGGNTGIGKETAIELAKRGGKIYLACRDKTRGEKAKEDIIEKSGSNSVIFRQMDLSSLNSVRNFVTQFKSEESKLDILINNAGIMMCPYAKTEDGFESQIGVNHLGHFLLTLLLLENLKASAPSRIINVSSRAHLRGAIKKDDFMSTKSYGKLEAYSQSKLANVLFTRELAKRLEGSGVTANALHPGVVKTELGRSLGFAWSALKPFMYPFMKNAVEGAQTTLYIALDPIFDKETGKYYSDLAEAKVCSNAENEETAQWLWEESEKLTNPSQSN